MFTKIIWSTTVSKHWTNNIILSIKQKNTYICGIYLISAIITMWMHKHNLISLKASSITIFMVNDSINHKSLTFPVLDSVFFYDWWQLGERGVQILDILSPISARPEFLLDVHQDEVFLLIIQLLHFYLSFLDLPSQTSTCLSQDWE